MRMLFLTYKSSMQHKSRLQNVRESQWRLMLVLTLDFGYFDKNSSLFKISSFFLFYRMMTEFSVLWELSFKSMENAQHFLMYMLIQLTAMALVNNLL